MNSSLIQRSLRRFKKTMQSLDLHKRITATKWLEGIIVAQSLTTDERDRLIKASNEYIGNFEDEEEYIDAVNALMDYFTLEQKSAIRALKKKRSKRLGKKL